MVSLSSNRRSLGSSHSSMHAQKASEVTAPPWATTHRHYPTVSSNYSFIRRNASICWLESEDGFSLGGAKWSCSFRTIGLQSAQQILEEPATHSSGHQFGSCGGSVRTTTWNSSFATDRAQTCRMQTPSVGSFSPRDGSDVSGNGRGTPMS